MKLILAIYVILLSSCNNKSLNGKYLCDSNAPAPSGRPACGIMGFEFKGKETAVMIIMGGHQVPMSYEWDEEIIKLKGADGSQILLKETDQHTLLCESFPFEGTYRKTK